MPDKPRPAWMTPIIYNDDRFVESETQRIPDPRPEADEDDTDHEELLRRGPRAERDDYECTDTTPVDYGKGPHEDVLDVEDDSPNLAEGEAGIDYERGPHEDVLDVEDDEDNEDDEELSAFTVNQEGELEDWDQPEFPEE